LAFFVIHHGAPAADDVKITSTGAAASAVRACRAKRIRSQPTGDRLDLTNGN